MELDIRGIVGELRRLANLSELLDQAIQQTE